MVNSKAGGGKVLDELGISCYYRKKVLIEWEHDKIVMAK